MAILAAYDDLLAGDGTDPWLAELVKRADRRFRERPHGELPRWLDALARLPAAPAAAELDLPAPCLGLTASDAPALRATLMRLHPWRKGPLCLAGVTIDSEWRSDLKWRRLAPHIDLRGCEVLDVGCGNGYFGWRMLGAGAARVLGVDPTQVYVMQWLACRHFAGKLPNFVLPLGIEDLPPAPARFDIVFSMGVLYHRRDPHRHLNRLRRLLRDGGTLVLETLVLPPVAGRGLLEPAGRYARMRNVWAVPGLDRLRGWLPQAGFASSRVVDVSVTDTLEQRSTAWMTFESLAEALDPADPAQTVEGHPAPTRAVLIAHT
jgi:tRNA (mo5U34)-methyltransferase